jgi:hypothetical protein
VAGSALIGNLAVDLTLETAAFNGGADYARKALAKTQKSLQATADKFTGIGKAMSLSITAPFAGLVATAIPAAVESAQALGQVNAALASMGPVAGKTSEQLQAMAGQLQDISLFDDDDILKSVTANMLTFGNVSGEAFERAQVAAVNLSARLGQDLQSSAIQVGKALNDPVKGVTALQRVGVSFTAQQKEQIAAMVEAGNVAGAQGIILGELEKQFGGAAKAQRDATPSAAMQQQWRTFQEVVGNIALKVLPPLTALLTQVLQGFNQLSPSMQTFIVGAAALLAVVGPLSLGIGGVLSAVSALLPLVAPVSAAFVALSATVTTTVIPTLTALGVASLPLLPWLAALAGAIALVYATWKHWPEIVAFVSSVFNAVKSYIIDKMVPILQYMPGPIGLVLMAFKNWDKITAWVQALYTGVKTWLGDKMNAVFDAVKTKVKEVGDAFYTLWDRVVGHSYVPDMVDGIDDQFGRLDAVMTIPAKDATAEVAENFATMAQNVVGSFKSLGQAIKNGDVLDILQAVTDTILTVIQAIGQVGSIFGGGGKTPQLSNSKFGGFRAAGGPVVPGKSYVVGENGPEWFTPRQSGGITPNGGGGMSVRVVPSPYFDVVVDHRATAVAAPIGVRAAAAGSQGAQLAQARANRQRLG